MPDNIGVIAIRLSKLGKEIFDKCKNEYITLGKITKNRILEIINENTTL